MIPSLNFLRRPLVYARIRKRYRNEARALRGKLAPRDPRPSIFHFTTERAASRYVGGMMQRLARAAGMIPVDFDSYFFEFGKIDEWSRERGGPDAPFYLPRGCYYGPLRTSTEHLMNRPGFRYLLSVRDPRDVLVSLHYNYAYEYARNRLTSERYQRRKQEQMEKVQRQSLDDFVLQYSDPDRHIRRSYEAYCRQLVGRRDVLLVRYEDMLQNFDGWLDSIVDFFELGSAEETIRGIREAADFTPSEKGPKRQVTPGEHRRTLEPATVRTLNREWGEVLRRLGYSTEEV